jgi:hypothetical protein
MVTKTTYAEVNNFSEFQEFLNLVKENIDKKIGDCHFNFIPNKYPYYVSLNNHKGWGYNDTPYKDLVISFKDLKKIIKKEQELEIEIW